MRDNHAACFSMFLMDPFQEDGRRWARLVVWILGNGDHDLTEAEARPRPENLFWRRHSLLIASRFFPIEGKLGLDYT